MKRQEAKKWLDKKYPTKKERKNIKELNISSGQNLTGSLNLEGFSNLEKLDCSGNLITNLSLDSNSEEKIIELNVSNNDFDEQDLTCFSSFVNLKKLYLGNTVKRWIKQGYYNRFYGSLELLKNLSKLEELSISNTNIDRGLEHLSDSLEKIYCFNCRDVDVGCEKIRKELNNHLVEVTFWSKQFGSMPYYDLWAWRREQKRAKEVTSLVPLSHSSSVSTVMYPLVSRREVQKAQKWLDKNYPKEKRSGHIELDIGSSELWQISLEGSLNLTDFKDLRFLNCSDHKITKLEVGNYPQLIELYCDTNQLTELDISNYPVLTQIDCSKNKLANLTISNCPLLAEFYCYNNQLAKFNFSKLNKESLTHLDLNNNPFSRHDLSFLVGFVNLKSIKIGSIVSSDNDRKKIKEGFYNHFNGCLEPLQNMTKLEILNINATDIDEGLEYLPKSLVEFYCTSYGTSTKVGKIEEELKEYPAPLQTQTPTIPQSQSKSSSVVLSGVGKTEIGLSSFSPLGPNYIENLRKWRKARVFNSGDVGGDNVSTLSREFGYEESQDQLEENSIQAQIQIPPK